MPENLEFFGQDDRSVHLIIVTGKGVVLFKEESEKKTKKVIVITHKTDQAFTIKGKICHYHQIEPG